MSGNELDLPLLRNASFGFESFRDNPSVVFEGVICECGVMGQICLCLEALRLDLSHSGITRMPCLRV